MELASLPKCGSHLVHVIAKFDSYNDYLMSGCCLKGKIVWAGSQQRGLSPAIVGQRDYSDRILTAVSSEFPLFSEISLPGEIESPIDWISSAPLRWFIDSGPTSSIS